MLIPSTNCKTTMLLNASLLCSQRFRYSVFAVPILFVVLFVIGCSQDSKSNMVEVQLHYIAWKKDASSADILIWPQPSDFRWNFDSWTTKCPSVGDKCAKRQPKLSPHVESQVDYAINNGPSAVAAFFSNPNGDWNYVASRLDSTNPTIYSHLTSGNYWMIRDNEVCDQDSVDVIALYLGHSSVSPSKANATYKLKNDLY